MKISVVTAVYNGAETIEDMITSVSGQTHSSVEHIIIDGESTDNTMAIVNRHRSNISVVVSEQDTGIYDAMNEGTAVATGDAIGFLNADDLYENARVLERVANLCSADPELDAC